MLLFLYPPLASRQSDTPMNQNRYFRCRPGANVSFLFNCNNLLSKHSRPVQAFCHADDDVRRKKKLKQTFPFTRRVYSKMNSFTGWSSSRQTTPSWHSRCWCFWYLLDVSVYGSWWWLPAQMWNRLFIYAHFQAGISLSTTRSQGEYSAVRIFSRVYQFSYNMVIFVSLHTFELQVLPQN